MIAVAIPFVAHFSSPLRAASSANFRTTSRKALDVSCQSGISAPSATKVAAAKLVGNGKLNALTPLRSTTVANGNNCAIALFGASVMNFPTLVLPGKSVAFICVLGDLRRIDSSFAPTATHPHASGAAVSSTMSGGCVHG